MSPARKPAAQSTEGEQPEGEQPEGEQPEGEQPEGERPGESADGDSADDFADIAALSYEQARDELAAIVGGLESGQVPLEESMALWRRGEALAAHCTQWLDGAQRQIAAATGAGGA